MEAENQIILAKQQLQLYGKFLNEYSESLNQILDNNFNLNNSREVHPHITRNCEFMDKPIQLDFETANVENITQFKLIDCDNKIFNKLLLTFSYLCDDIEKFCKKSEKLQRKFLYFDRDLHMIPIASDFDDVRMMNKTNMDDGGSTSNVDQRLSSEDYLIKISESMRFLCDLQLFINSGIQIGINLLQQLTAFHSYDKKSWRFQFNLQYQEIFYSIQNFMITLIRFDEILSKSNFHKLWPAYKKTIVQSLHQQNHNNFKCSEPEQFGLINILNELELLFCGFIFQTFLENTYRIKDRQQISTKNLNQLVTGFNDYIKESLQNIKKFPIEISDLNETQALIGVNAFVVLHHRFFGQVDQKQFKQLLELNTKFIGISLLDNFLWHPEEFLRLHAETLMVGHEKYIQEQNKYRQIYLQNKIQNLPKFVKKYCIEITLWTLQANSSIQNGAYDLKIGQFKQLCTLLLQGMQYAGQITHLVKSIINLQSLLHIGMDRSTVLNICKLLEFVKLIQLQLSIDLENISKIIKYIKETLQYKCLHIIIATKKKLSSELLNDQIVDIISALKIIEKCLNGPTTSQRIFIVNLLTQSNSLHNHITTEDYEKLKKNLRRLKILSEFQANLNKICDVSFIFWHQTIIDEYFKQIIDNNMDFNNFHHILHSPNNFCSINNKVNKDLLKYEIISKLCGHIETFLRIEAHSGLQLKKFNPFEHNNGSNLNENETDVVVAASYGDSKSLINRCLVQLNGEYVSLKYHIENYLSNMFYNLTTIHLHDWKAYEEMRQLAKYKHNLEPINDYLPTQTLEQGIDALEIMRNIHIFVTKYNYNMNNQYFVESSSKNKYLNTICIKHVANSLRTHGSGIINTAVNFSYQFLRQKFYTFSQFLYDEQIHSRLMKEYRYIFELKLDSPTVVDDINRISISGNASNQFVYKYERADDFNKEIRKLGISPDGLTYMDMFRQLITEVGNTMGYIRLIRSGNVHANYTASQYLPRFNTELKFNKNCESFSELLSQTSEILEDNLKNYMKHFSEEEMDFFKLLISAFKPFFCNPNNQHLKTFFLIVPPLMINYVEYILNAREKITKRDRGGSVVLFDDGFAMGLVCILKLLNQFSDFESLHWFKSIEIKFKAEHSRKLGEMQQEINKNQKDQSLVQTLALVEKRMNAKFREYSLLRDSIYSAKIFFQ